VANDKKPASQQQSADEMALAAVIFSRNWTPTYHQQRTIESLAEDSISAAKAFYAVANNKRTSNAE
jgi:hypothetical protein